MSLRRTLRDLAWTLVRLVLAVMGGAYEALARLLGRVAGAVAAAVADHPLVERADDTVMGAIYDELEDPRVRHRVEELFSRKVLGSVLVGATTTRAIEVSVGVAFGELSWLRIPVWDVIWVSAVALFVWWDRVEHRATGPGATDGSAHGARTGEAGGERGPARPADESESKDRVEGEPSRLSDFADSTRATVVCEWSESADKAGSSESSE